MNDPIKVYIVEDAPKTRKELANLLADEKGFAVVGEASSVREALVGIKATLPEAVLLDISLPDGSGVEILEIPLDPAKLWQLLGAAAVLDKLEGLDQARRALLALSLPIESR